jgi:predicted aspartyl protease
MQRLAYDRHYDPPAPMAPLLLAAPLGEEFVLVASLLDSGADCTLVPVAITRQLRLPQIDHVLVEGMTGGARRVPVHAAAVRFAGLRLLARVVAHGDEAIIGRDLLNRAVALLDGPRLALSLRSRSKESAGRKE